MNGYVLHVYSNIITRIFSNHRAKKSIHPKWDFRFIARTHGHTIPLSFKSRALYRLSYPGFVYCVTDSTFHQWYMCDQFCWFDEGVQKIASCVSYALYASCTSYASYASYALGLLIPFSDGSIYIVIPLLAVYILNNWFHLMTWYSVPWLTWYPDEWIRACVIR